LSFKRVAEIDTKGSFGTSIACVLPYTLSCLKHTSPEMDDILLLDIKMEEFMSSAQRRIRSFIVSQVDTCFATFKELGHSDTIRSLSFSPGSNYLAAAGDSKVVSVYDIRHGEQIANFTGQSSPIMSVDWNRSGQFLLTRFLSGSLGLSLTATAQWMVV
jgi:WD40 repeat protein